MLKVVLFEFIIRLGEVSETIFEYFAANDSAVGIEFHSEK